MENFIRSMCSLIKGLGKKQQLPPEETYEEFEENYKKPVAMKSTIPDERTIYVGYKLYFSDSGSSVDYCAESIEEVSLTEVQNLDSLFEWMVEKREQSLMHFTEGVYYLVGGVSVSPSHQKLITVCNIMTRDAITKQSMQVTDRTVTAASFVYFDCEDQIKHLKTK